MYKLRFLVYNINREQYEEVNTIVEGTEMDSFERAKSQLEKCYSGHFAVMSKDEFKDPARSNLKPISKADIAEVQMDLIVLSQGRDMYEVF